MLSCVAGNFLVITPALVVTVKESPRWGAGLRRPIGSSRGKRPCGSTGDGRNVIGVLAIDVPNRNSLPDHEAVLDADVKEVAVTTAEGIARLLKHDYNAD